MDNADVLSVSGVVAVFVASLVEDTLVSEECNSVVAAVVGMMPVSLVMLGEMCVGNVDNGWVVVDC